jgi:hypothetical protein
MKTVARKVDVKAGVGRPRNVRIVIVSW